MSSVFRVNALIPICSQLQLWSPEVASTPPVHRELRVIPDFGDYIPPEGHFVEDKESFLARKAAEAIKYGNYDGL